jgi:hypothetical protein
VLALGLPGATTAPTFSVDSTSTLNLTDNDLVDQDGSLSSITAMVKSGFNAPSGYWNGYGIQSSVAVQGRLFALGISQPSSAGTFDNESVTPADVEIRYTYYGDADLNGHVNSVDYPFIDNGFLKHLTGWNNGDFNYDNVVNGSDYTLIDNAFNTQSASLDALIATTNPATQFAVIQPAVFAPTQPTAVAGLFSDTQLKNKDKRIVEELRL